MKNIVREVFSLPSMEVVKASYKNSVYYIAGSIDITDYVSKIKNSSEVAEIDAIKFGLNAFYHDNPSQSILTVQQFNLVILNNPSTPTEYMIQLISDIFRKDLDESNEMVELIHNYGSAVLGTYTYEIAHTFACMIETSNNQMGEVLNTDIVPVYNSDSMDSLEVIEQLIRRDFPEDL